MIRTCAKAALAVALLTLPIRSTAEDRPPIVAVFNVEVKGVKLAPDVVDRLSDYLSGRMAEGGRYQVVPRERLKESLVQKKKESYRQCYAQSCQIELGQELAAQKTLATQVMRFGTQCKATVTLFDLARATTENSATASGPCTEEGIVATLEAAVARLLGGNGAVAPVHPVQTEPPRTVVPASGPAMTTAPDVEESGPKVKKGAVTAAVGNLTITGKTPAGTAVRLEVTDPDGKLAVSGSPFQDARANVGTWKVVAKASGHETEIREVRVPPDDAVLERIELKPFGSLRVTGEPAGAAVKVRGPGGFADDGGLPWEGEGLRSGTYRVEVSRPGYSTDARDVAVEPGRTAAMAVKLEKGDAGGGSSVGKAGITWVRLPGGTYEMGTGNGNEGPRHRVTVKGFQMAKTEITVAQYRACVQAGACTDTGVGSCGQYGNWDKGDRGDHPMNCIDWSQAGAFCRWAGGRLPSEAEWEYAARSAGRDQEYPWGNETATCDRAVMKGNGNDGCGRDSTWPVCSKTAGNTAQGLCDMAGNVWEWVQDWYHDTYSGAPTDGRAREDGGSARVNRGGGWNYDASYLRAALRNRYDPSNRYYYLGARCLRSP